MELGQKKVTAEHLVKLSVVLVFDPRELATGEVRIWTKANTFFKGNTLGCQGCGISESFGDKLPMGIKEICLFTDWFNERHKRCKVLTTISAKDKKCDSIISTQLNLTH
jgi:hypothetical protein